MYVNPAYKILIYDVDITSCDTCIESLFQYYYFNLFRSCYSNWSTTHRYYLLGVVQSTNREQWYDFPWIPKCTSVPYWRSNASYMVDSDQRTQERILWYKRETSSIVLSGCYGSLPRGWNHPSGLPSMSGSSIVPFLTRDRPRNSWSPCQCCRSYGLGGDWMKKRGKSGNVPRPTEGRGTNQRFHLRYCWAQSHERTSHLRYTRRSCWGCMTRWHVLPWSQTRSRICRSPASWRSCRLVVRLCGSVRPRIHSRTEDCHAQQDRVRWPILRAGSYVDRRTYLCRTRRCHVSEGTRCTAHRSKWPILVRSFSPEVSLMNEKQTIHCIALRINFDVCQTVKPIRDVDVCAGP